MSDINSLPHVIAKTNVSSDGDGNEQDEDVPAIVGVQLEHYY